MSVQSLKIRLHVLSPIHIGCDDVYEPTSFVIDEQKKILIEFDPMDFIKALPPKERDEFAKKCSGDNLLDIFKFIKRAYKSSVKGKEVEIAQGLLEHYKKVQTMSTFDKKTVINQFTMSKTAYNPQTNQPYIPGSSLKGSLRTAYLSALATVKGIKDYYRQSQAKDKAKELEKLLLNGSFGTDPFRMVKVSDLLPVDNVKTKIVYAVNKKKKKSDKETKAGSGDVYQIFETIKPGSIFEGIISIQEPLEQAGIQDSIKADHLLLAAHRFYAANLKLEIEPMNTALELKHAAGIAANAQFKDNFKKTAFLIRLGRHSGAEAVTIEGNRNIKIKGRGNEYSYQKSATTFWLASEESKPKNNNGLLPFGWAVMEVLNV